MDNSPGNISQNTKKLTVERNYICGCKKSYLSYPALYTHVKIKHNGVFLVGSIAKRKINNLSKEHTKFFAQDPELFFEEFKQFLTAFPDAKGDQDMNNFIADCDKAARCYPNIIAQEIFLGKIKDKQETDNNISAHIAGFLEKVYPCCSSSFFRELVILCLMLISSNVNTNENFPIDLNNFVAELFVSELKKVREMCCEQPLQFLGTEELSVKYLLIMCRLVGDWLFHNKVVKFRAELNIEF